MMGGGKLCIFDRNNSATKRLTMKYSAKEENQLFTTITAECYYSPLTYVMMAFPWGEKGTPLEDMDGPRSWQKELMLKIEDHIKRNEVIDLPDMLRSARSSGRGIGKSALVAWLVMWFMSTRLGGTCIVTANTEAQLKSRTFAELGKWHAMAINGHWFEKTALILRPAKWFDHLLKADLKVDTAYYYAEAQLWSEENPDAFAGAHSHHGMMLIMDEASGIPTSIFDVSEGFFTEPTKSRFWFCFSNPRRNSGAFYDCFHKNNAFWDTQYIDSRTVEGVDRQQFDRMVEMNGEHSDVVAVEVKGQFPSQGSMQFISSVLAEEAMNRDAPKDFGAPTIVGVDVARYGDDESVIATIKGRDGKSIPPIRATGLSTMALADKVANHVRRVHARAVFVDGAGVGGGVVDRLRQMGFKVFEVNAGSSAADKKAFCNKKAEMYQRFANWLETGAILNHQDMYHQMTCFEYKYDAQNRLVIESKDELKKRGESSPDLLEAYVLCFAEVVGFDYNEMMMNPPPRKANTTYQVL